MKIKELNIERFGTIRNLKIKTEDGMNYIYGLDDDEKTAVTDFITVMLYGTVNNYREDIREKYLPLDGSDMSGSMVFELKNEEYLLERVFNAGRHKKDTIRLTNRTTETTEDLAYNVKPGEYLFSASKDIFFRNTYINSSDTLSSAQGDSSKTMSAVLSNLISTGAETTSVSDVAKMLNSYCDPGDSDSISYSKNEKKDEMNGLREILEGAQKTENLKLQHQQKCNELHKQFNQEQKKFEKIKTGLELQDMMNELDSISGSENSEQKFFDASDRYNQLTSELKKSRLLENRRVFDKAYEKYKRIVSLTAEQNSEIQQKTALGVELGRYTPKGDAGSLQDVVSLQNSIENTVSTLKNLQIQLDEKRAERNQIRDKVREAKDRLSEAEKALTHHEETARIRIEQAESTLHSSSYNVDTKPVNKSKNLAFAIFLLAVLIALLIVFLTKPVLVVIIGLAIVSDVYAIFVKLGKEKKVKNYSRVDENQLRVNERSVRNLRNSLSTERDSFLSKVSFAKNQYEEIKRRDTSLKNQLKSLEDEIASSEQNLAQYRADKENAEKNITSPDPKFYSIRSEINDIERNIDLRTKSIDDFKNGILSDLSVINDFSSFEEAEEFIRNSMNLLEEYDKLSDRLSVLGDKEKSQMAAARNKMRAEELSSRIAALTGGREVKRLTSEEYVSLQKMAQSLLEENSRIKDEYISEITKLKIQYNDSTCVANTEHRIHRLQREIEQIDSFIKTVKLAIDAYNEALRDIHDEYAPAVARRTSEILSELTRGKYTSISIKGGKIVVKDREKNPVNLEKVSKSTCDQIYIALRIAVAEVTAGKMNYPVILGDIFMKFSETRSSQLLRFLLEYSEKHQILIFSSQNRIATVASHEDISIDKVNVISV